MLLHNNNAKIEYYYNFYWVWELDRAGVYGVLSKCATLTRRKKIRQGVTTNQLTEHIPRARVGTGKYCKTFLRIPMGFDIETTTIYERYPNDEKTPELKRGKLKHSFATMYCWQLSIGDTVIMGNSWQQFIELLNTIKELLTPTNTMRCLIFIHNASYEMAFMRKWLNVTDSFLKEQRHFLQVTHDDFFMFRDSMAMNNSSLARLASDYCNTQKCKGDLDYSIVRNKEDAKNMTPKELAYCHNDVLILSEYWVYFYEHYLVNGFNPLTITATLRNEVKKGVEPFKVNAPLLQRLMPQTEAFYNWVFYWVYRGGYVHANRDAVGELYHEDDNIVGVDFTSSYPSVILYGYRPLGHFRRIIAPNEDDLRAYSKKYCVLFKARFWGIRAVNGHSIESHSKCHALHGAVLDNGRVYKADMLSVSLCELDYFNYCDFYRWEYMYIEEMYICDRAPFPSYVIKPMIEYYQAKAYNKAHGLPYALEKAMVNSFYGMLCTRRNTDNIKYTNGGWVEDSVKPYDEWLQGQFLSPYDGVYVSAGARRNLLATVKKLECNPINYTPALYCDTDSIKILNYDDYCQRVIDEYNLNIMAKLYEARTRYPLTSAFDDLGMFDLEYGLTANTVTHFKTLGSKRYCISTVDDEGEIHNNQTIAGLPKGLLFELYPQDEVYEKFRDGLTVSMCKLTAVYQDEEQTELINGVEQTELSHVALVPIDFRLSMDRAFISLLQQLHLDKRGKENG